MAAPRWRASEADVTAIIGARHGDPFAVLGPHATAAGLVIRALVPGATSVCLCGIGRRGHRDDVPPSGRIFRDPAARSAPRAGAIACMPRMPAGVGSSTIPSASARYWANWTITC